MKILKSNNNFEIEMSEEEWNQIGTKNEWKKTAQVTQQNSPLNESPDLYSQECNVFILGNLKSRTGEELDLEKTKALVKFSIDIETRSWGIKDVYVRIESISPIDLIDADLNPVGTVTIDPGKIRQEYMNSKRITVGGIDLSLLPDMTVDYGKTSITIENTFQNIM